MSVASNGIHAREAVARVVAERAAVALVGHRAQRTAGDIVDDVADPRGAVVLEVVVRVKPVLFEDVVLELDDHLLLLIRRERQELPPDRAVEIVVDPHHPRPGIFASPEAVGAAKEPPDYVQRLVEVADPVVVTTGLGVAFVLHAQRDVAVALPDERADAHRHEVDVGVIVVDRRGRRRQPVRLGVGDPDREHEHHRCEPISSVVLEPVRHRREHVRRRRPGQAGVPASP